MSHPIQLPVRGSRRSAVMLVIGCLMSCTSTGCGTDETQSIRSADEVVGPVFVTPQDDLQAALDRAARATVDRRLVLRSGEYSTDTEQFCLLALTRRHSGVIISGDGEVILTARRKSSPERAAVSHILYCGDGVSAETMIENLTLTGARGRVTEQGVPQEDDGPQAHRLQRGMFFQLDGGALKVFGDSAPRFRNVSFINNESDLCGGAVSIEQQGVGTAAPVFENCRFDGNRCPATGSAIDVLQGSAVKIDNCLFIRNISNYGMDRIKREYQLEYNPEHGCGALTVFPGSVATVSQSTFHGNWNAVDDHGGGSRYEGCLFDRNDATDNSRPGAPYELDIRDGRGVVGCVFNSDNPDLRNTISRQFNILEVGDPLFDEFFVPGNPACAEAGYRPR